MTTNDIGPLAAEISNWLYELAPKGPRATACSDPWCEFPYAEALYRWYSTGKPASSRFVVSADEDPLFFHFREDIVAKYGLRILTPEEAELEKPAKHIRVEGYGMWLTGVPFVGEA